MHRDVALALLLTACGADAPETRELWRGTVDGIDIVIGAERRAPVGWTETISTWNARLPAPRHRIPGPPEAPLAREPSAIVVCPIVSGVAFRIEDRPWRVLWVLAGRVFDAAPPLEGERCDELAAVPDRHAWLAEHPGGATTCLALDEEGDRIDALDCLERAPEADLPLEGAPAGPPTTADLAALRRRIAEETSW